METLDQLLFLELEQLIRNHTIVKKCRNCDRFFITDNMNVDYCDRLAPGEQVACSVIGSKRAFDRKLDQDMPLKLYNRAYKTHYARKMKGMMIKEEFESWRDEAKRKLSLVRSGSLNADVYGKWLKE